MAYYDLASMSALRLLQTMSEAGRMWLSSFTGQEEDNIQILPLKLSPTLGQWCGQIITSVYIHVISKQVHSTGCFFFFGFSQGAVKQLF